MEKQDIRWKQRFINFNRAVLLLKEALETPISQLSQLEKEGTIQRFEFTFELAWKTLKDRMEYEGILIERISPRTVVRTAFEGKYIQKPELWFQMIDSRNLMSHTYDFEQFEDILKIIQSDYLPYLLKWHQELLKEFED